MNTVHCSKYHLVQVTWVPCTGIRRCPWHLGSLCQAFHGTLHAFGLSFCSLLEIVTFSLDWPTLRLQVKECGSGCEKQVGFSVTSSCYFLTWWLQALITQSSLSFPQHLGPQQNIQALATGALSVLNTLTGHLTLLNIIITASITSAPLQTHDLRANSILGSLKQVLAWHTSLMFNYWNICAFKKKHSTNPWKGVLFLKGTTVTREKLEGQKYYQKELDAQLLIL